MGDIVSSGYYSLIAPILNIFYQFGTLRYTSQLFLFYLPPHSYHDRFCGTVERERIYLNSEWFGTLPAIRISIALAVCSSPDDDLFSTNAVHIAKDEFHIHILPGEFL